MRILHTSDWHLGKPRYKYSGKIALRTPKSLHKRLVANAEKEGVSLNQYLVYLLSKELVEKK